MVFATSLLSILLAIITAAYLQLPTFFLALGYRWFYRYERKRWFFRMATIAALTGFALLNPPSGVFVLTAVFTLGFLAFSFFNANPNVYIALDETQVIKLKTNIYCDATEVLGYVDDEGQAIAYPLEQLVKPRHLLNDMFMNAPLLVSYCMACRSAMLYNPVLAGRRLRFVVLGVFRRNMVMCDRETGTIWQQGTGEAMFGPLAGSRLDYLPYQQTTIQCWLQAYPDSCLAYEADRVKEGLFSKERLMKMMRVTEKLVAPGRTDVSGLPLRATVFGIDLGDASKAYPQVELQKTNGPFTDRIGTRELIIEYRPNSNFLFVQDLESGQRLVAQSHWWFGWKEFHPNTAVWQFTDTLAPSHSVQPEIGAMRS